MTWVENRTMIEELDLYADRAIGMVPGNITCEKSVIDEYDMIGMLLYLSMCNMVCLHSSIFPYDILNSGGENYVLKPSRIGIRNVIFIWNRLVCLPVQ